jgi:hypothetical protein
MKEKCLVTTKTNLHKNKNKKLVLGTLVHHTPCEWFIIKKQQHQKITNRCVMMVNVCHIAKQWHCEPKNNNNKALENTSKQRHVLKP